MVLEYMPKSEEKKIPHDKKAYLNELIEHYGEMIEEARNHIKNIEEQMRREKKKIDVMETKQKHYKKLMKKVI